MKKLFLDIKKHPKSHVITAIIAALVGFGFYCIFYFWLGKMSLVGAINGTGVAGAVLVASFVFTWLTRNGAFDTISYGFNQMFASMFGRQANKYNDMVDYKEQKNTKRESASMAHVAILTVGILYFIAFGVLEIVLHSLYQYRNQKYLAAFE